MAIFGSRCSEYSIMALKRDAMVDDPSAVRAKTPQRVYTGSPSQQVTLITAPDRSIQANVLPVPHWPERRHIPFLGRRFRTIQSGGSGKSWPCTQYVRIKPSLCT